MPEDRYFPFNANMALDMTEMAHLSGTAARMRAYRRRRRRGKRCVQVQIGATDIDSLIAKGYLSPTERGDFEAIEAAVGLFFSDALFGWNGLV